MNSFSVTTYQFVLFFLIGMFLGIGGISYHDLLFYVIIFLIVVVQILERMRDCRRK